MTFDKVSRDRLYYDKYQYSISFNLTESNALHTLTVKGLDRYFVYAKSCSESRSWYSASAYRTVTVEIETNIYDMALRLIELKQPYKKVVSYNWVYLYSNDINDLESIASAPYLTANISKFEAIVDRPRDVVQLINPKYKFRTYFTNHMFKEGNLVGNFLLSRPDCFGITPGVKYMLSRGRFYMRDHNFVDHHNEQDLLMLALVCPDIIRKTVPIVAK